LAGAGAKVLKHGGRAASATSSSADLLTALGVQVELGPEDVVRCVEQSGMGFCFAPRFHPAMRHAAPTRRELGAPTVFNFIAPLSNPARPRRQVLGVSDPGLGEKMLAVLQANGATRAMVVYGHDGLDELTTTTTSTVLELHDGKVSSAVIDPSALGLARATAKELQGGDAAANAAVAARVLAGEQGPHRDIVVLNAAAGIIVAGLESDWRGAVLRAQGALDGGQAQGALEALVTASQA
jgi:anthranilate phosphoribosyltransferase